MLRKNIVITNPMGLQKYTIKNLCRETAKFKCQICFTCRGTETNAKSVLSMLAAGIRGGDEITLMCEGEDEAEAMPYLTAFIEGGIGE